MPNQAQPPATANTAFPPLTFYGRGSHHTNTTEGALPKDFLTIIAARQLQLQLTDEDTLRLVVSSLRGYALEWYEVTLETILTPEQYQTAVATWAGLKPQFVKAFIPTQTASLTRCKNMMSQAKAESPMVYATRIRQVIKSILDPYVMKEATKLHTTATLPEAVTNILNAHGTPEEKQAAQQAMSKWIQDRDLALANVGMKESFAHFLKYVWLSGLADSATQKQLQQLQDTSGLEFNQLIEIAEKMAAEPRQRSIHATSEDAQTEEDAHATAITGVAPVNNKPQPNYRNKNATCGFCHKKGHTTKQCFAKKRAIKAKKDLEVTVPTLAAAHTASGNETGKW